MMTLSLPPRTGDEGAADSESNLARARKSLKDFVARRPADLRGVPFLATASDLGLARGIPLRKDGLVPWRWPRAGESRSIKSSEGLFSGDDFLGLLVLPAMFGTVLQQYSYIRSVIPPAGHMLLTISLEEVDGPWSTDLRAALLRLGDTKSGQDRIRNQSP